MRISAKVSLLAASIMFAVVAGAPVLAVGAANSRATAQTQTTGQSTDTGRQAAAQTRLADAKLKACQNREKAINNIMSRIADRGQKQLDLFTSIAERTEKFYSDKGKTLSNYDALVANVTAKKDAAQTAVDSIKASSVTFKCDGTDPKGAAQTFKDSLKSEIEALKAYRSSIKDLIVGVKSVQGSTTSSDNQPTGGNQ
jgi:hypothetical protein